MATKRKTPPRNRTELADEMSAVQEKSRTDVIPEATRVAQEAKLVELRERTAGVSVENAVKKLTDTGLSIGKAIADVQSTIAAQVSELTEIRQAIEEAKKELEEVYGKEVAAASLAQLVADYEAKKKELDEAIELAHDNWEKEQAQHATQVQEENAILSKNRSREESDYIYRRDQVRRQQQDEFNQQLQDAKRTEALRKADLERGWTERETKLASQEQEVAELRTKVTGLPNEIEAAVEKKLAIVTNVMKKDHAHEIDLLKRDAAAKEALLTAEVNNLKTQLVSASSTIANLSQQLNTAQEKVAKIASDALTAASGTQALTELRQVVSANSNNGAQKKS
jgi:chromosome segregation ATPase